MIEQIKKPSQPKYTLFIPFTRLWLIDEFLLQIDSLDLPRSEMEVVFYNDSLLKELHDKLLAWLQTHTEFNGLTLYTSGNIPLGEHDIMSRRRDRIVEMKKKSIELIGDSQFVYGLEDDTFIRADAFSRLLGLIESDNNVAITSGIQMGRHAMRMVGAWSIKPLREPRTVSTLPFGSGIQQCDGVGWFCYITRTHLYKTANYRYEDICLGPDVCYAWDLRKRGYKVLIDWGIVCEHRALNGTFIPNTDNVEVGVWHNQDGKFIKELKPHSFVLTTAT